MFSGVDAAFLMNSYEDNTIGLDDRNEYQQILPLVRVEFEPNKCNNMDEMFAMIMSKESKKTERTDTDKLTQQDLCKLDSFGTALARLVDSFFYVFFSVENVSHLQVFFY